jgi:hypothetical protein
MKAVYALYPNGQSAQQGVNRLRAAGITDRDITVISSEPMEDYEFGHMDSATWIWWIACAGGLIGMAAAAGLAYVTETSWPINTGGLPIWAWWPNLIIMFELTMLFGILAAVLTLLVTARLPGRRPALYDPAIMDGRILVGVNNPADAAVVERALRAPGAEIKRTSN